VEFNYKVLLSNLLTDGHTWWYILTTHPMEGSQFVAGATNGQPNTLMLDDDNE